MRVFVASLVLSTAVLLPKVGNTQVNPFRTTAPEVNAADASWQVNSEPIVLEGLLFYPTREYRQFDPQVMAQVGLYQGVPMFADTTLEPWSIVYAPVGRERMRAYERPRTGELAGTSGSRAASFVAPPSTTTALETYTTRGTAAPMTPVVEDRPVGTAGAAVPRAAIANREVAADVPERTRVTRTRIESIPRPSVTDGVWLEFNGNRWYSAGSAVPFRPDRFTPVGVYRGFPVYRSTSGDRNLIWVSVVRDGPLAPYEKR